MKRPFFHDSDLQQSFDQNGFVVVEMFTPYQIEELKTLLAELKQQRTGFVNDSSYKLSFFSDSAAYREKVFKTISAHCQPFVDRYLANYEPLIINTFDKEPGSGEVPIHQNWTFVDESKHTSVSVWIPLIDTTRLNGTMEVVRGSNGTLSDFRSPTIPWVFENLLDPIKEQHMEPIDAKLGQAVILDDSILHYTSRNDSEVVRTAIQLIMKPNGVSAIHYHKPDAANLRVDVYEVDWKFFTSFNMREKPSGVPLVGHFELNQHFLSESEFLQRVGIKSDRV
jgi:hypothetical protein